MRMTMFLGCYISIPAKNISKPITFQYCVKCDRTMMRQEKFCPECGTKTTTIEREVIKYQHEITDYIPFQVDTPLDIIIKDGDRIYFGLNSATYQLGGEQYTLLIDHDIGEIYDSFHVPEGVWDVGDISALLEKFRHEFADVIKHLDDNELHVSFGLLIGESA